MFINELNSKYIPELALIIYRNPDHRDHEINEFHLESSDLVKTGNQYVLGATKRLQKSSLDDLAKFLGKRETKRLAPFVFESIISPQVLFTSQHQDRPTIIWSKTEVVETLHFEPTLGIPDGQIKLPNLVFKYDGSLSVYAIKTKTINAQTKLYNGPFHNTSSSGVCMGTAKISIKSRTWEALITACEVAFFNSMFTHFLSGSPISKGHNLNNIFKKCLEENLEFPREVLVSAKATISKILPR